MKDKLNWKECMKRKCEQCKYYNKCFKEESLVRKEIKVTNNDRAKSRK